jgi:hypothetical protein
MKTKRHLTKPRVLRGLRWSSSRLAELNSAARSLSPRRSGTPAKSVTIGDTYQQGRLNGSRPSYLTRHPELAVFRDYPPGFDHLAESPRDHVAYVLETFAKDRKPPPQWAAERFGQVFPRSANGGRPRKNALLDLFRVFAVDKCGACGKRGRYERAARLLHEIPTELFSGLEVAAGADAMRNAYRSRLTFDLKNDYECLRHYFPLLVEAIEKTSELFQRKR